ncbi:MAG TPA: phosphoribosylanthranilate isomerase [Rhodanobacter sp.]|jgi:phosphoribosylanthranilate isomerase|nr:phosphoribosylanthranilate isomerase [Rhodanobacter sp.]
MTRIKCCGMTRVEDAVLAARLGADAIGLVFTARSRRQVSVAQARAIRRALPPFVTTVALFMDDAPELIEEVIETVSPDLLQFHGTERDAECARFGRPYLKAIAMGEGDSALPRLRDYPGASALLLDGHGSGEAGGSGRRFDWTRTPRCLIQPLVLAGGLRADNVAVAIRLAQPWAVDVASGVESAPGIKDAAMLADFIAAVRAADRREAQA